MTNENKFKYYKEDPISPQLCVYLGRDLHRVIKQKAYNELMSEARYVVRAIRYYLECKSHGL